MPLAVQSFKLFPLVNLVQSNTFQRAVHTRGILERFEVAKNANTVLKPWGKVVKLHLFWAIFGSYELLSEQNFKNPALMCYICTHMQIASLYCTNMLAYKCSNSFPSDLILAGSNCLGQYICCPSKWDHTAFHAPVLCQRLWVAFRCRRGPPQEGGPSSTSSNTSQSGRGPPRQRVAEVKFGPAKAGWTEKNFSANNSNGVIVSALADLDSPKVLPFFCRNGWEKLTQFCSI